MTDKDKSLPDGQLTPDEKIAQLEKELCFYKGALSALPNPVFIKNDRAQFVFFNNRYNSFFGVDSTELLGTTVEQSEHLDDMDKFRYHVEDTTLLEDCSSVSYEVPFVISDGSVKPSLYWSCGFCTSDGGRGLIGEIVEVSSLKTVENTLLSTVDGDAQTEQKKQSDILREQNKQFYETVLNYYDAQNIMIFEFDFDAGLIKNLETYERGQKSGRGMLFPDIKISMIEKFISSLKPNTSRYINAENFTFYGDDVTNQYVKLSSLILAPLFGPDDELFGMAVVANPNKNTEKMEIINSTVPFIVADLETAKQFVQLMRLSIVDRLTGAFNRNKYIQTLQELEKNKPERLGILLADVNGLTTINEFYGSKSGDVVLTKSVTLLKDIFGENVYRVGDDEFIVLLPATTQIELEQNVAQLKLDIAESEFCNLSFGYLLAEGDFDLSQRIAYANELMNVEKQSYYRTITDRRAKIAKYSHDIIQTLLRELRSGRFTVYFHAQIDLKSRKLVGAEALVRKVDADGNIIPPLSFLPFYESEKIIRHVDLFVIETVCATLRKWISQDRAIKVAVNLSRVTLMERDIIKEISQICDDFEVPRSLIELEITETNNSIDDEQLKAVIGEAKNAGFSVSLDDFGSEYSNLQMLTSMDFAQIKLDKSLIGDICSDLKSSTIVEYVIKMCDRLRIGDVLAEGIETEQQIQKLLAINCPSGQGYYFSKPLPLESFEEKYFS